MFNAPFSNTRSVAELVIGEVIALARQLGDRSGELHRGTWKKVAKGCYEIRGKTLGIVGYGHIGSQVCPGFAACLAPSFPAAPLRRHVKPLSRCLKQMASFLPQIPVGGQHYFMPGASA